MFSSHQADAGQQRHTRVTRDVERVNTTENYNPLLQFNKTLLSNFPTNKRNSSWAELPGLSSINKKPHCIIVLFGVSGGLDNLNDLVVKIKY